jgi:hypothetical protein
LWILSTRRKQKNIRERPTITASPFSFGPTAAPFGITAALAGDSKAQKTYAAEVKPKPAPQENPAPARYAPRMMNKNYLNNHTAESDKIALGGFVID